MSVMKTVGSTKGKTVYTRSLTGFLAPLLLIPLYTQLVHIPQTSESDRGSAVHGQRAAHHISSPSPKSCAGVRDNILDLRCGSCSNASRAIPVSIQPGIIAFTRIPCPDHSIASARVNPSTADF